MPAWGSSNPHVPRRSHEISSHSSSPSPLSDDSVESAPRRMSSEVTPRPTPATTRFLSSPTGEQGDSGSTPSRRLGYIADKLTSSLTGTAHHNTSSKQSLHPNHLPMPVLRGSHQHSRSDPNQDSLSQSQMSSNSAVASASKLHTSPSKASYGRTYDSKLVSREMHRLGNLGHIPSALAPPITTAPSTASHSLPTPASQATFNLNTSNDPWGALHVHVLPLFNGEPLRIPIEDLNTLVKRHIQTVVPSAPSKAVSVLERNASELIASGMVTLNAKLMGTEDSKLVARVVEIWGFFWDQVLTYVEGVLLPLQTDPLLSSLHRAPKSHHRATSPVRQATKSSISTSLSSQISATHIDVRSLALRSFRDKVILPLFSRLHVRLSMPSGQDQYQEPSAYQQPRLQQMLLVLASQRRQRPIASLTAPIPPPTPGEAAIDDLLHVVRNPRPRWQSGLQNSKKMAPMSPLARAPSFLSGAQPRDRRGRIALKQNGKRPAFLTGLQGDDDEDHNNAADRDKEREFLDALRSPDGHTSGPRGSVGGWGLGAGHEEPGSDEEDFAMDMRQAQEEVERMVGMSSPPPKPGKI